MCSPTCGAVSLIINFYLFFYSFCLLETFLLSHRNKSQGHFASRHQRLALVSSSLVSSRLLLLLLLSRFSRVRLCATPQTAATRLLHPWDSPGKDTGVGCHFLSNTWMHAKLLQSCSTLCDPMDSSPPASSGHRIL